jgi:hypothetical protein
MAGTITYVNTRTDELPKPVKREIRQLAGLVHERLLALELRKLEGEFARWRLGELDAFELAALVHKFHEGQPRKLWSAFNTNQVSILIFRVREGWKMGILAEAEISAEMMAELRSLPDL